MKITEGIAGDLADTLRRKMMAAEGAASRVWRILDPQHKSSSSDMPYPPDEGWLNALEGQATIAAIEVRSLLVALEELRGALAATEPVQEEYKIQPDKE